MNKKLTKDELDLIRQMNEDSAKYKMALGELEIQKAAILKEVDAVTKIFTDTQKNLAEKYGADSIINVKTGEVTKQEKDNGNS